MCSVDVERPWCLAYISSDLQVCCAHAPLFDLQFSHRTQIKTVCMLQVMECIAAKVFARNAAEICKVWSIVGIWADVFLYLKRGPSC